MKLSTQTASMHRLSQRYTVHTSQSDQEPRCLLMVSFATFKRTAWLLVRLIRSHTVRIQWKDHFGKGVAQARFNTMNVYFVYWFWGLIEGRWWPLKRIAHQFNLLTNNVIVHITDPTCKVCFLIGLLCRSYEFVSCLNKLVSRPHKLISCLDELIMSFPRVSKSFPQVIVRTSY